jgi:hypothetical protein
MYTLNFFTTPVSQVLFSVFFYGCKMNFAACPYTLTASLSYVIPEVSDGLFFQNIGTEYTCKITQSYISKDDTLRQNSVSTVKVYVTLSSLFFSVAGNVIVKVECKAWAHNIKHDRRERIGLTQFQLLIDESVL